MSQGSLPEHEGRQPTSRLEKDRGFCGEVFLRPTVGKGVFARKKVEQDLEGGQQFGKPEEKGGSKVSMK